MAPFIYVVTLDDTYSYCCVKGLLDGVCSIGTETEDSVAVCNVTWQTLHDVIRATMVHI